jgi:chloride channel protein, CIC family
MRSTEPAPAAWWVVIASSVVVGLIAGYGAVVFRAMIAAIHNLCFLGRLSLDYDANLHTPASPWGLGIIVVPVAGAVVVAFLVKTFAPEAKGHGVPEVMDAVYYHEGKIRPIVAAVKSIASAISIGSGGSVGREGPIIQIGAAFGSAVGQVISMPARQRAMLIAAGAGGGIAATFNTPIGGIVFAIELVMPVVSPMSLLCVALSCVAATYVGRSFFGVLPSFNVPSLALVEGPGVPVSVLPWFVLFGLLLGLAAWTMTRGLYWFEDLFDSLPGNYYTRHMSGMFLVGLIVYGFMTLSSPLFGQPNHYYVQGVGYATIMDILRGDLTAWGFLLLLAIAKLLVTVLTLGSGASGGVFSPSMFIGAALGGCVGSALTHVFPGFAATPAHFAYAGMAAMVGGTTGAAVTATIMVFEMTRDYTAILPVILTVALASAVRQWLSPSTIYTLKLLRRGHVVPQGLQGWMGELRSENIMTADFQILSEEEAKDANAVQRALLGGKVVVVKGPDDRPRGVIDPVSRLESLSSHVVVEAGHRIHEVLRAMHDAEAHVAVVTRLSATTGRPEVLGVINERDIARAAYVAAKLAD